MIYPRNVFPSRILDEEVKDLLTRLPLVYWRRQMTVGGGHSPFDKYKQIRQGSRAIGRKADDHDEDFIVHFS